MTGLEIAAIAKTTNELTKDHQKGFIHWFLITCFGKHYFQYLSRSLLIEGAAKIDADRKLSVIEQNPNPAISLMLSESELDYKNMFGVLKKTIPKIKEGRKEGLDIDKDKFKRLKDLSKEFSSDDMQEIISGILAGEYNEPGSYSLKTMDIVKSLSKDDINLFRKFCGIVVNGSFLFGSFFNLGNENHIKLHEKGLTYGDYLYLQELGLLTGSNTAQKLGDNSENTYNYVFNVINKDVYFKKQGEITLRDQSSLTKSGMELFKLIDPIFNEELFLMVKNEFIKQGFEELL